MPEVELAEALAAGATAGLAQAVRRIARDAWTAMVSLPRRHRDTAEEPGAADQGEESGPVTGPRREAGKYSVVSQEINGAVMGDNARQINHFRHR